MDLSHYIHVVLCAHPDFTPDEIQEVCEAYLERFDKKTKEESKHRSLTKYLSKEFGIDLLPSPPPAEEGAKSPAVGKGSKNTDTKIGIGAKSAPAGGGFRRGSHASRYN